jgi:uncharacterized paraquat-inducible protein A
MKYLEMFAACLFGLIIGTLLAVYCLDMKIIWGTL